MTTPTKQCSKCLLVKVMDAFSRNKRSKDGHNTWCRMCKAAWYSEHQVEQATLCSLRRKGFTIPKTYRGTKTFGAAVRKARERKGVSIDAAAGKIGIGVNVLADIELGKRDARRSTIVAVVKYFNLPPRTVMLP